MAHKHTKLLLVLERLQASLQAPSAQDGDVLIRRDAGASSTWQDFARATAAWQATWRALPEPAWAMYFKDTGNFLSALLGAWLAGKTIYVPGDTLTRTTDLIAPHVAGFVGDFDGVTVRLRSAASDSKHEDSIDVSVNALSAARTLLLTSGSTGQPKIICKTLAQLCAEIDALHETFAHQINHGVTHATVSHQHFYGFIFRALLPLLEQRPLAGSDVLFQEDLIHLASGLTGQDEGITLISSPAFLSRLTERDDWDSLSGKLTSVFSAGGPLTDERHAHIEQLWGIAPHEVYGSTEHGVMAYRHMQHTEGVLTALNAVQIMKTAEGVLALRSGYMDDTELVGDWAVTSDKIELLNDKQFQLQGRADRIIKIEEKRISLTQMEAMLAQHPLVRAAHLLPLSTPRLILGAAIVLNQDGLSELAKQGRARVSQTFKKYLSSGIEHLAIPRRWRFVNELPVNAQGKLEFHTLNNILNTEAEVVLPIVSQSQRNSNVVELTILIPSDLIYLEGHFSGQPIVAGVVLVDWVAHFSQQLFGVTDRFKALKQLKFHRIIEPNERIVLALTHHKEKNSVVFAYTSESGPRASGHMVWGGHDV
ncbi:MAG: AMP-binding protein [Formosimonas sp.]